MILNLYITRLNKMRQYFINKLYIDFFTCEPYSILKALTEIVIDSCILNVLHNIMNSTTTLQQPA